MLYLAVLIIFGKCFTFSTITEKLEKKNENYISKIRYLF